MNETPSSAGKRRVSLRLRGLLTLSLLSVPYVLLFTAGSIWLYQTRMLIPWLAVSLVVTLVGWRLMGGLQQARTPPRVEPDPNWPPREHAAWQDVEALARCIEEQDLPLDRPDVFWNVLREVLETVARHYHPKSEEAWLEIPVPYVLRIVELVSKDLREATATYVPGAHIITVHDWQRLWKLAGWANRSYFWYRVATFLINSPAAVVREVRDAVMNRLGGTSGTVLKRWAVGFAVRRAGYYAIRLYGGHLLLDDGTPIEFSTRQSRTDARRAPQQAERLAAEPLRILVVGQVKAGKSSLINALFGEYRAATDVIPRTAAVEPYVLQRDGLERAIILDTAGYDVPPSGGMSEEMRRHVHDCDLLLLVVSALSAARHSDRVFLDAVREHFQRESSRHRPAMAVVLTRVDQLRPPGEWAPPYDLRRPTGLKAQHMAAAVLAVAEDLAVPPADVVPVCLRSDGLYNVEEVLVPAILGKLPEAQRARYLRCLRSYHQEEYWSRLWQQAVEAGRLLGTVLPGGKGRR